MKRKEALNLKPGDKIKHIRRGDVYVVDKFDIKNRIEEHSKYFQKQ